MKVCRLFVAVAPCALVATPCLAGEVAAPAAPVVKAAGRTPAAAPAARPAAAAQETFSTGVAKGRDRLDSATSSSALKGSDIAAFGAHSLSEVLRNIPGLRVDDSTGEGGGQYTIRGLPQASTGSKFMQLEEDGLPVLEFGDIFETDVDNFMRVDFNLAQIEALRGGSASTFASNSPGGVINLISRTGETPGGAIQVTEGLTYGEHRIDADYGGNLSDSVRYHVGGFYRDGEGPRHAGFDAYHGGQIKFNVTRQFANGYVRLYGKYLDDHAPAYTPLPIAVTGSDANPVYANVPGIDVRSDAIEARYLSTMTFADAANHVATVNVHGGQHPVAKAIGLEAQFDVGGWTISDKFRYAAMSGDILSLNNLQVLPAFAFAAGVAGPGARLSYANGPDAGQAITNPLLNGNGLISMTDLVDFRMNHLDNVTNDLRTNRVWRIGGGTLTLTAGFYKARQTIDMGWFLESVLTDVRGGGNAALINLATGSGLAITQDGVIDYGAGPHNGAGHVAFDVRYDINAPYGSLNYHIGRLAIGGSLRYDAGSARGIRYGSDIGGGRIGVAPVDINGDGVISIPESTVSVLPLNAPALVHYNYGYLSYSIGVNYRVAPSLAVFARYSRGGRAAADRLLFANLLNDNGSLINPQRAYDAVRQAEGGVKFRTGAVTLNLTGFSAIAGDVNTQLTAQANGSLLLDQLIRTYKAQGAEFEGAVHRGPFSISAGATFTHATIADDLYFPAVIGHTPRAQPKLIFSATPRYDSRWFSIGANVIGTTGSYAQDTDQLRVPGYTTVNAFVDLRPTPRMQVSVHVTNLFNVIGLTSVTQPSLPQTGVATATTILGRTVAASLRVAL